MKVTLKLLIANVKMTIRNKSALFWSLMFPLIFIGIFGLFDMEKGGSIKMAVVDQAKTEISQSLVNALKQVPVFKLEESQKSEEEITGEVRGGNVEFGFIIPKEIETLQSPAQTQNPIPLKVYYDGKNVQNNSVVLGTLNQFITQTNLTLSNAPVLLTLSQEPVDARKIKYIEFITTGMLGMAIMQFGIIGVSISLTRQRELNVLKKLLTTPLSLKSYVTAFILNNLVLSVIQITILLATAHFLFGANIYGSLLNVYLLAILGTLIFLCFGFVVAGIAKNLQSAQGLAQVITMPMMFLSGVFFSTELLPDFIGKLVKFLPLTPLITAIRKVSLDGVGLIEVKTQIFYLLAWLVVSFALAVSLFRFSESKE